MLNMFRALMPREDRFFDLFSAHAQTQVDSAAALRRVLDGGPDVAQWCARVMEHEHEADDVARQVLLAVRRSFITPFDRGDIRGLTNSLDDSVDQMQKTAKAILLFDVTEFAPGMRELGDLIVECAALSREAVALLPHMRRNVARLNELTEQLNRLESRSDDMYDAGMKALFKAQNGGGDAMAFIIGAEIYDHLEKVVDRFEDVANRINGILVEHL
jgi:uncharacterized protein